MLTIVTVSLCIIAFVCRFCEQRLCYYLESDSLENLYTNRKHTDVMNSINVGLNETYNHVALVYFSNHFYNIHICQKMYHSSENMQFFFIQYL